MGKMMLELIINKTKFVVQVLEQLRLEYESLVSSNKKDKKYFVIKKSIENIDGGLSEAKVIITYATHLQNIEIEKQKLKMEVQRLHQENSCLRNELHNTQQKLQTSEQLVAQLEEQKKHLECEKSIKKCNVDKREDIISERPRTDTVVKLHPSADNTLPPNPSLCEIPARLKTLYNLVFQFASNKRYDVAVPLCKQALEDLEKIGRHDHPDVATMFNLLALVYRDQNKYTEAVSLLKNALAIRKKYLGENHPAVAATLNNLAVLYGKIGKYKKAESVGKLALAIRETVLGTNHPDVAKQLNNLALLCQNLGKYDKVENYYQRALEIYETKLGGDDVNAVKTKNHLAGCYVKQGKYKQAEMLYKQLLTSAHVQTFGAIDSKNKVIWQIAEEREERKYGKRENTIYREYGAKNKTIKTDSPTVTAVLQNLEALYIRRGMFTAAEVLHNFALQTKAKKEDLPKQSKVNQ